MGDTTADSGNQSVCHSTTQTITDGSLLPEPTHLRIFPEPFRPPLLPSPHRITHHTLRNIEMRVSVVGACCHVAPDVLLQFIIDSCQPITSPLHIHCLYYCLYGLSSVILWVDIVIVSADCGCGVGVCQTHGWSALWPQSQGTAVTALPAARCPPLIIVLVPAPAHPLCHSALYCLCTGLGIALRQWQVLVLPVGAQPALTVVFPPQGTNTSFALTASIDAIVKCIDEAALLPLLQLLHVLWEGNPHLDLWPGRRCWGSAVLGTNSAERSLSAAPARCAFMRGLSILRVFLTVLFLDQGSHMHICTVPVLFGLGAQDLGC